MSLTDDINNLPATPQEVMPGHLDHHATIHSALKNHDALLTTMDSEIQQTRDEVGATKWDRGYAPVDATLTSLGQGSWAIVNKSTATSLGLPRRFGRITVQTVVSQSTALFISDAETEVEIWATGTQEGVWQPWERIYPPDIQGKLDAVNFDGGVLTQSDAGRWDSLPPKVYTIGSSAAVSLGLPSTMGGKLTRYWLNPNGTAKVDVWMTLSFASGRMSIHWWQRYFGSAGWQSWEEIETDLSPSELPEATARRSTIVDAGLRRRGGIVGTGGKPVIALRFDHHLDSFGDKVLPLLKQYRLPWGQMINPGLIGTGDDNWTWNKLAQESHASGGEVWNHGHTHGEVYTEADAEREVTFSLDTLRNNLPSLWIDGYAPPGSSDYMGMASMAFPEDWYGSYPGRLVLAQHAFIRGYGPGPYLRPNGQPVLVSGGHMTMDAMTSSSISSTVRSVRDTGSVLTFMLHPNYLDDPGYLSTSDLGTALAYIAQLRDLGQITVLSTTGALMADSEQPPDNFLGQGPGTVSESWSGVVSSRLSRGHLGVPHEAESWVMGSGSVSLRVQVTSPTYPVDQSHTVTLVAGVPQRLSVLVTPPMDTTATTVSLTGSVSHTGIRYRPI